MRRFSVRTAWAAQGVAASLMFGAFFSVWQRALDAVAGRTLHAGAAFWLTALGGAAAGALLAWWLCRHTRNLPRAVAAVFLLSACWLVVQLAAMSAVTGGWQRLLVDSSRTSASVLLTLGKTAAFFLAVPSLLAGVALYVAWHAAGRVAPEARRSAAAGMCAGLVSVALGWAAALLLVPSVGVETLTRQMALGFGVLASLSVLAGGRLTVGRSCGACLPALAVMGLAVALLPADWRPVALDGSFGRLVHRDSGFAQGQPLFGHVTRRHAVVAYDDPDYQFVFAVDGRPLLFGNRFHSARTLTGYVPLVVRPKSGKAALIGAEAGVYLPFFVRAGVNEIEVLGADRDVVKLTLAADAFLTGSDACENAPVAYRPALGGKADYDVIFLAPEPLWMRGAEAGVSRSLFSRCQRALSGDGVVALHLDARGLSAGRFAQIARDFSAVFPGVQLWCTGASDWVMVGSAKEIKTPADSVLELFEREAVFRDFLRAGGVALPEMFACMLCDGKGLLKGVSEIRPEGRLAGAWSAPLVAATGERALLQPAALEPCRQWKAGWLLPGEMDVDVYVALLDKVGRTLGARAGAVQALAESASGKGEASLASARAAAKISARDALLIQLAESIELEGRRRIKIGDLKGALKCYENLLSFSAGTARSHYGMGYCLRGNGDNENAFLHFARAVAFAPEQIDYRLELAQAALSAGKFVEADRQFREILKRQPDHAEALFRFAKGLAMRERPDKDYPQAVKLAERACQLTRWNNGEYAFGLADLYMEAGRVLEGMGLKRTLKEGGKPEVQAAP